MMQSDKDNKDNKKEKIDKVKPPKPIKKKDFVISAPTNFRSFDENISVPTNAPPQPPTTTTILETIETTTTSTIITTTAATSTTPPLLSSKIYFKVSDELLLDVKKWENKKKEYSKSIESLLNKKQEQLNQIFQDYLQEMKPIIEQHFNDDELNLSEILQNEQSRLLVVQQQLFGVKNASITTIENQIKQKRSEIDMHNKITLIQSIVRGWLAKKKYKQMRQSIQLRKLCCAEIIETERKYVESLSLMIKLFLVPLQTVKKDLISTTEIQSIFGNCSVIYGVHRELLDSLESTITTTGKGGKSIADCFLSLSPFLKLYTQYINNFNNASNTLIECKKRDSKVNQFFFKDNRDNLQLGKRDFLDLQIQPVQRIPRYRLLLTELLRCTPVGHVDYENVKNALNVIQELAMKINESKRTAEGLEKMVLIQSSLTKNIELVKPHRKLIKEGPLKFEKRGKLKDRHLFLFNDSLLLCKKDNSLLSSSISTSTTTSNSSNNVSNLIGETLNYQHFNIDTRYVPISFMDMNNAITLPTQDPEYQYGFAVLGNEHLYFYSKNAVEQHEWLLILKEITKELDQNLNSLKKEVSEMDLKDSMLNPMVKQQDSNRDSLLLATSITNPKRQSLKSNITNNESNQPKVIERYSGGSGSGIGVGGNLNSSIGSNSSGSLGYSPPISRHHSTEYNNNNSSSPPTFSPTTSSSTFSPPPFNIQLQQQQQVQQTPQPILNLTIRELISIYSEINELQKELINPSNQFELLLNGQIGQIQIMRQQYPNVESVFNKLQSTLYRLSNLKNQSSALLSNQNTVSLLQSVIVQGKDHIGAFNEWIKRTYPAGPSDPSSTQPRFLTINFMKWYNNLHTVWGQVLDLQQQS